MYDTPANETAAKHPQRGRTFRCDHCRRLLGARVHTHWHHMRFCSAACVAAYQGRLHQETVEKMQHLDSRTAAGDGGRARPNPREEDGPFAFSDREAFVGSDPLSALSVNCEAGSAGGLVHFEF
jgi:hypothetical protein